MNLDARTFRSLGFYLGMVLLVGQLVLRGFGIPFGGPFDWIFLGGSFVLVLTPMFGTEFVLALIRELRSDYGGDDRPAEGD